MQKFEFEKRIGLAITQEEFEGIGSSMNMSVDEDTFVEIWLKEGGIQELFDKRRLMARSLMGVVKALEERNRANVERLERMVDNYAREIKELRNKLSAIGALANEEACREWKF